MQEVNKAEKQTPVVPAGTGGDNFPPPSTIYKDNNDLLDEPEVIPDTNSAPAVPNPKSNFDETMQLIGDTNKFYKKLLAQNKLLNDEIGYLKRMELLLKKDLRHLKKNKWNAAFSFQYLDATGNKVFIIKLSHDSFSLMKVAKIGSLSWYFSLFSYFIQITLLLMIIAQQSDIISATTETNTDFKIPFKSNWFMRLAQSLAIIVTVAVSRDLFIPIKEISNMWFTHKREWSKVVGVHGSDVTFAIWLRRLVFPDVLQLVVGCLALLVSFAIIIQSDNVIYLFAEFAAMGIIAEIDNISFWFADNGYIGETVKKDTKRVKMIRIEDRSDGSKCLIFGSKGESLKTRSLLFFVLVTIMYLAFAIVIRRQLSGYYLRQKYPSCDIAVEDMYKLNDGVCDGGFVNSFQCGFDGGDCIDYKIAYPTCNAVIPEEVGDGICQKVHNVRECGYDGGDCCPVKGDEHLGDGVCHGGWFNTANCLYDNGDCDYLRKDFPSCVDYTAHVTNDNEGQPVALGDGLCDRTKFDIANYMNEACGWVFGDCLDLREKDLILREKYPNCKGIRDFFRIGDGICDGDDYLTEACGWEELDCCEHDHSLIGDGNRINDFFLQACDSFFDKKYLNRECAFEQYDCCNRNELAGNGICMDNGKFEFLSLFHSYVGCVYSTIYLSKGYTLGFNSALSTPFECANDGKFANISWCLVPILKSLSDTAFHFLLLICR